MKKKFTAAFLTLAALGTLATLAPSAQAWWKREYLRIVTYGCGSSMGGGGCAAAEIPVHDTYTHPKYLLKTLNIEVYRTQPVKVTGKICRQVWYGNSVVCSSTVTSPNGTGHYALNLGSRLGIWTAENFADFGYAYTSGETSHTNAGRVNGMYIAD